MELKEVQAIDTMCRAYYCDPEVAKEVFRHYEFQIMGITTFGGVMRKLGIKEPSELWRVLADLGKGSVEAMLQEMGEIGVECVFMDQMIIWSVREHTEMCHLSLDYLAKLIDRADGRIVGGAGYNPFKIKESLEEIETAVRDYGFKYVWFHPISFGLRPNDKKCYPLYAKCLELEIPVCMQVGHSAEPLPSEPGHPMYVDEVAIDFPDLKIVLTHTGWPWVDEWISMLWRHPNVYGNIGACYPSDVARRMPQIIDFMDRRGRDKVLWATNGFGLTRCKKEFLELPLKDETKKKVLRENAIKVFKLR